MAHSIDHAAAQTSVGQVPACRASCSCGWLGPLRQMMIEAVADEERHQEWHAAYAAGFRLDGREGVNGFASHHHGGPPPDLDRPPLGVPVELTVTAPEGLRWHHAHDGGSTPHVHELP